MTEIRTGDNQRSAGRFCDRSLQRSDNFVKRYARAIIRKKWDKWTGYKRCDDWDISKDCVNPRKLNRYGVFSKMIDFILEESISKFLMQRIKECRVGLEYSKWTIESKSTHHNAVACAEMIRSQNDNPINFCVCTKCFVCSGVCFSTAAIIKMWRNDAQDFSFEFRVFRCGKHLSNALGCFCSILSCGICGIRRERAAFANSIHRFFFQTVTIWSPQKSSFIQNSHQLKKKFFGSACCFADLVDRLFSLKNGEQGQQFRRNDGTVPIATQIRRVAQCKKNLLFGILHRNRHELSDMRSFTMCRYLVHKEK